MWPVGNWKHKWLNTTEQLKTVILTTSLVSTNYTEKPQKWLCIYNFLYIVLPTSNTRKLMYQTSLTEPTPDKWLIDETDRSVKQRFYGSRCITDSLPSQRHHVWLDRPIRSHFYCQRPEKKWRPFFFFRFWKCVCLTPVWLFALSESFKFHGPQWHSKLTEWTSEVWIQEKVLNSHAAYLICRAHAHCIPTESLTLFSPGSSSLKNAGPLNRKIPDNFVFRYHSFEIQRKRKIKLLLMVKL